MCPPIRIYETTKFGQNIRRMVETRMKNPTKDGAGGICNSRGKHVLSYSWGLGSSSNNEA